MRIKNFWNVLLRTLHYWSEDKVTRLSAALAYYMIFSLGPLLLICIAIAGLVFGNDAAQGNILQKFSSVVGPQSAEQIQAIMQSAHKPATGIFSTILGVILLFFAAVGLFGELQSGLNTIWGVKTGSRGIKGYIKDRFLSFTMILGIGFLLLVSLLLSLILNTLSAFISDHLAFAAIFAEVLNFIISLAIITLLFAMIYKILPDLNIRWREVWLGAFLAALLFTIGKTLLGIYLGLTHVASAYGAAGSFIVILIWVYYSAQILFFGAEFTKSQAIQKEKRLPGH